jgi:hypothetical protein
MDLNEFEDGKRMVNWKNYQMEYLSILHNKKTPSAFRIKFQVLDLDHLGNKGYIAYISKKKDDIKTENALIYLFHLGFDSDEFDENLVYLKKSKRKNEDMEEVVWKLKENVYIMRPTF